MKLKVICQNVKAQARMQIQHILCAMVKSLQMRHWKIGSYIVMIWLYLLH